MSVVYSLLPHPIILEFRDTLLIVISSRSLWCFIGFIRHVLMSRSSRAFFNARSKVDLCARQGQYTSPCHIARSLIAPIERARIGHKLDFQFRLSIAELLLSMKYDDVHIQHPASPHDTAIKTIRIKNESIVFTNVFSDAQLQQQKKKKWHQQ